MRSPIEVLNNGPLPLVGDDPEQEAKNNSEVIRTNVDRFMTILSCAAEATPLKNFATLKDLA